MKDAVDWGERYMTEEERGGEISGDALPLRMFAVRKIGRKAPYTTLTMWPEEAESWMSVGDERIIVNIERDKIQPGENK